MRRALQTLLLSCLAAVVLVIGADTAWSQDKVDLNAADAKTLSKLPGIDKKTAKRIVAWRKSKGPLADYDTLLKIKGFKKKALGKLKEVASVGPEKAGGEDGVRTLADRDATGEETGDETPTPKGQATPGLQRSNRMEFDGRLIRGQSAGAGAVFLFERAPRPLPSMVERRSSYLADTVRGVLGSEQSNIDVASRDEARKSVPGPETSSDKLTPKGDKGKKTPRRRRKK